MCSGGYFIEQLLIRGHWASMNDSREVSEAYYQLKEKTEQILAFDETLSDDGKDGARLKSALTRMERERSQIRYLNTFLNGINEEAQEIIDSTLPALIVMEKHFKSLDDDLQKTGRPMINNWKELGGMLKLRIPMSQMVSDISKNFAIMVELISFFKSSAITED